MIKNVGKTADAELKRSVQVGMAKEYITPELDCLLYGYPRERHAVRVMDPLSVGVVAIVQGEEKILLVSAEICALNPEKNEEMRKVIGEAVGIKWENIIYSSIHTHSGPVTHTYVGWGEADMDYLDHTLVPATIKAAKRALDTVQPAKMGIGTVESMAGINRRQLTENGEVILGQNPQGPYDPTMTVICFCTLNGDPIGSIIHFGCHPTAAGSNFSITRDWPGIMVDRIEEISGAPCMYINGAEGDIGPRLSNGATTGDESHVTEIGLVAAKDAEKAYLSIDTYENPDLSVAYGMIEIPYIDPPALEEVIQRMAGMGDPKELVAVDIVKYAQLANIKEMYETGQEFPKAMEMQQTVIALGSLAMVPFCFETFSNVSRSLREKSPYQTTVLLGLTGGSYGYLPTEDELPYGGYEVDSFRALGGKNSFVENASVYIVDQNVDILCKLKEKK